MHGCVAAWMHCCMDALMHGCIDAWMHGCLDACIHAYMHPCMHACMDACMHVCMYACMHVSYACKGGKLKMLCFWLVAGRCMSSFYTLFQGKFAILLLLRGGWGGRGGKSGIFGRSGGGGGEETPQPKTPQGGRRMTGSALRRWTLCIRCRRRERSELEGGSGGERARDCSG